VRLLLGPPNRRDARPRGSGGAARIRGSSPPVREEAAAWIVPGACSTTRRFHVATRVPPWIAVVPLTGLLGLSNNLRARGTSDHLGDPALRRASAPGCSPWEREAKRQPAAPPIGPLLLESGNARRGAERQQLNGTQRTGS